MHVDAYTQVIRPAQMEHDPHALDEAEAALLAVAAEYETIARRVDVLDGTARRHPSSVDRAELRAATLAEDGARQRLDTARREAEERRVVAVLSDSADQQAQLARAVEETEAAAAAALDAHAAVLLELAGEQRRLRAELAQAARAEDLPARIRLTGQTDRYDALPAAVTEPGERLARLAAAARRRAGLP
jgi:hypothetical protein